MASNKSLWPLYLGGVIPPMGGIGILTILPVIARDWGMSIQWISLAATVYMVPFAIFQLFSGPIAHIFDARKTLLFGFGVYGLGAILSGLSTNLTILLIARFIWGFGAAFVAPIIPAVIGEMIDPLKAGRSMGVLQAMYTCGMTMGPLVAGLLEVAFGWPAFFFCMGILSIAIAICYGHTVVPAEKKTDGGAKKILDALPLIQQAYSIRDVRFLSFAAFFLFMTFIGLMTFTAEYLKEAYALPSDRIGLVLSMSGILGIAVSPVAGILGDRWGQRQVAYAGGVAMGIAIIAMGMMDYAYGRYILFFSIFGSGSAMVWTAFLTLAIQIEPELRKPVVSFYNCIKFLGYALAPFIFSIFYVPFSIAGVRWACLMTLLVSLFLIARIRKRAGVLQASDPSNGPFPEAVGKRGADDGH